MSLVEQPVVSRSSVPVVPDPTTASAALLRERCLEVRVWADQCNDIGQAVEALDRVAAVEAYLAKKGQEHEAQEAARWLEVRIGELLGDPKDTTGRPLAREQEVIPQTDRSRFRKLAAHRDLVAEMVPCSRNAVLKAIKQAEAADRPEVDLTVIHGDGEGLTAPNEFAVIVIDPPWRYDNTKTRGAAEDHYGTMTLDELAALELPAAADAHLYLWVTNSFLPHGFDLLAGWGFTYKTCLTWCKPQIGMGNWFRNTTEHVLFGVRGSLATLRNDCPTHFVADRTKHSAKPESFYDLVQSCSPGPYLEMFARQRRLGWHVWGNEA